ncbi:TPA: helicase RepA family protein [Vibrio alginolyticus]
MLNKIISFIFTRTTNNNEGSAPERNVAPPLHKSTLEPHLSNQNVVRETKARSTPSSSNYPKKKVSNDSSPELKGITPHKILKFLRGSQGFDRSVTWCINNIIPARSLGAIVAPSSSLKSFIAIDLACSISAGTNWCGNNVTQGATLYVAAEGALGASRRIRGWEIKNGIDAKNLFVLDHSIFLTSHADKSALISKITSIEKENNVKFTLIILDTLARNFSGDENTQKDMGEFINECDSLKSEIECSVLLIHHTGKDTSKGGRGSSSLRAACDYEFQIQRIHNTHSANFICTKQKDAEEHPPIEICLETINLGIFDDEGGEITTLVKSSDAIVKQTTNNELANRIVLFIEDQPDGKTTRKQLREHLYPLQDKLEDKERKQLQRAISELLRSDRIRIAQQGKRAEDGDEISVL